MAEATIRQFIRELQPWGRENRIDYPWRKEKRVFLRVLTELLLRRTTAEAVHKRWAMVLSLSDPRKVLQMKHTDLVLNLRDFGLVNSRVLETRELASAHLSKPLHKRSYSDLLTLRGIGPYTAAAVLTFIGGQRIVMSDSNYARVFGRLLGKNFIPGNDNLHDQINDAFPKDQIKFVELNQAVLDFSKLVCRPSHPKCQSCFANSFCYYNNK